MIRVAIVEDDQEIRELLQNNFEETAGFYCVGTFDNGETALSKIILLEDKPEVIIMDIDMPKMNGIECTKQLKLLYPEINILIYTIFEKDKKIFEALKIGADGYILKSDSFSKILTAITEVRKGGAPMSRAIAKKVLGSFREIKQYKSTALEKLTDRQLEILTLLDEGLPYRIIADRLDITTGGVRQHLHKIFRKLQVNNRIQATQILRGNSEKQVFFCSDCKYR